MTAGAIVLALAWSAGCAVTSANTISLSRRDIQLQDVVSPACLGEAQHETANLVVAAIPFTQESVQLTRAAIASLVRRRVPSLAGVQANGAGSVQFQLAPSHAPRPDERSCFAASHALNEGDLVGADDVAPVACTGSETPISVRYDRISGVGRASRAMSSGDYLGRVTLSDTPTHAGEALDLTETIGPVRIERDVVAAQSVGRGRAIFVRDGSGAVFSAPLDHVAHANGAP